MHAHTSLVSALIVLRTVGNGLHEDLQITNFNQISTSFSLGVTVEADFVDVDELPDKRRQRGELRQDWRRGDTGDWELSFDYRAKHHYEHQGDVGESQFHRGLKIRVRGAKAEPYINGLTISFDLNLKPCASWQVCLDFIPLVDRAAPDQSGELCALPIHSKEFDETARAFLASSAEVEIPQPGSLGAVATATLARARDDLMALRLYDTQDSGWTVAGGVPLYVALFGRDTLMTGWQTTLLSPQILRGTLAELSRWQTDVTDHWRDGSPNRMLHEAHTGPLSMLNFTPRSRYYGTVTTPVFYPIALAEFWRWTGDSGATESHIDTALRSLKWMDDYSRSPRHGFFQYKTCSEQGVKNQAWKDSSDAIVYDDGSQVNDPIATCETQGYYFAACEQLSQLLWVFGREDEAKRLRNVALEFKKRFNATLWMESEGLYGLGLDQEGKLIRSVASNAGHCLGTGIADPDLANRTADRLLNDDMFSGWGVRTLSAKHPAYNPYSYHRGSVWPVEQGALSIGFRRYNKYPHLLRLCQAQFELAALFEYFRLPEVVSGHHRSHLQPFPALYPDANSPQAWSAASVFAMLCSMLGLVPWAPFGMLYVDPCLPEWLPEITIRGLRVGGAVTTIRFCRELGGGTDYEILDLQGKLRVERRPDAWSLLGVPGESIREQFPI
jgi:glycogen debranching enzyme